MSRRSPFVEEGPPLQYPSVSGKADFNIEEALRIAFANLAFIRDRIIQLGQETASNQSQIKTLTTGPAVPPPPSSSTITTTVTTTAVTVGTHILRLAVYPPAAQAVGALFYETDREVLYVVSNATGINEWVYAGGVDLALAAAIPADLGTGDTGFLFFATDTSLFYIWTGTAFRQIGGPIVVFNEVPAGAVDGANVTFTLAHTPTTGTLMFFSNGVLQTAGATADYTLAAATITTNLPPLAGAYLIALYAY